MNGPPPAHSDTSDAGARPDARARLIAASEMLYRLYPIAHVGVEMLIGQSQTAKATMYKIFGSKEGLTAAVMEQAAAIMRAELAEAIGAREACAATAERLVALLRRWRGTGGFSGCLYLRLASQVDLNDAHFAPVDRAHRRAIQAQLAQPFAGADRELRAREAMLILHGAAFELGGPLAPDSEDEPLTATRRLLERVFA